MGRPIKYDRTPRECLQCKELFIPRHRGKSGYTQKFCNLTCNMIWQHAHGKRRYDKPGLEATIHPTTFDIAWAAGIYEGEGWTRASKSWDSDYKTQQAYVGQKDRELCDKLRELFGGNVMDCGYYHHGRYAGRHKGYTWHISGPRARGFLMTIYKFLLSRRQQQLRAVLLDEPVLQEVTPSGP